MVTTVGHGLHHGPQLTGAWSTAARRRQAVRGSSTWSQSMSRARLPKEVICPRRGQPRRARTPTRPAGPTPAGAPWPPAARGCRCRCRCGAVAPCARRRARGADRRRGRPSRGASGGVVAAGGATGAVVVGSSGRIPSEGCAAIAHVRRRVGGPRHGAAGRARSDPRGGDHPGHAAADVGRATIDVAREPTGRPSAAAWRSAVRGGRAPAPARAAAPRRSPRATRSPGRSGRARRHRPPRGAPARRRASSTTASRACSGSRSGCQRTAKPRSA